MTVYEPGTVAVATVRGVPNVRVMWRKSQGSWLDGWYAENGPAFNDPEDVTDVRPLVVLDLDYIRFERYGLPQILHLMRTDHRLAPMADQIEAQTKPPRIPEPGLWGVVKASGPLGENESANEDEWVRTDDIVWRSRVTGWGVCWDQLADPVLIRDGIEDGTR